MSNFVLCFFLRSVYNPGIFCQVPVTHGFPNTQGYVYRHPANPAPHHNIHQAQPFSQQNGHTEPVTLTEQHRNVQHVNLREYSARQNLGHSLTIKNLPGHRQSEGSINCFFL